jgi:hypothetical protein
MTINDYENPISPVEIMQDLHREMSKMTAVLKENLKKEIQDLDKLDSSVYNPEYQYNQTEELLMMTEMLHALKNKKFASYTNQSIVDLLNDKMKEYKNHPAYRDVYPEIDNKVKKELKHLMQVVEEVEELSVNKINELDEEYEKKKESIELPYDFTKSDYIKDIIKDANKSKPINFNEMKEMLEPIFDFINNPYSQKLIENHSLRKDDLFEKLESAASNLTHSYFAQSPSV